MSNPTEVYQQYYNANVSEAFQKNSILSNAVRNDGNIIGNVAWFRKSNKIIAQDYNLGSPINYANTKFEQVKATLTAKIASDIIFDANKPNFNFDESKVVANNVGAAFGRIKDQKIIDDALEKATTPIIGDVNTYFTVELLLNILQRFNDLAVPLENRYILHKPVHLTQLLRTTKATSSDYNTLQALQRGAVDSFMTFKFILIEERDEGGLRGVSGGGVKAFAFAKDCVGFAQNSNVESKIERVSNLLGYQHTALGWIGAVNIRDEGIVPIVTKNVADNEDVNN
jgi:hypothetical protein